MHDNTTRDSDRKPYSNVAGVIKYDYRRPFKRVSYYYEDWVLDKVDPNLDWLELRALLLEYSTADQEYYRIMELIKEKYDGQDKIRGYTVAQLTHLFGGRHDRWQMSRFFNIDPYGDEMYLLYLYGFNFNIDRMGRAKNFFIHDLYYYIYHAPVIVNNNNVSEYIRALSCWSQKVIWEFSMYNDARGALRLRDIRMVWEDHPDIYLMKKRIRIQRACQAALHKVGIFDQSLDSVNKIIGLVDEVPKCIEKDFKKKSALPLPFDKI